MSHTGQPMGEAARLPSAHSRQTTIREGDGCQRVSVSQASTANTGAPYSTSPRLTCSGCNSQSQVVTGRRGTSIEQHAAAGPAGVARRGAGPSRVLLLAHRSPRSAGLARQRSRRRPCRRSRAPPHRGPGSLAHLHHHPPALRHGQRGACAGGHRARGRGGRQGARAAKVRWVWA